MIKANYVVHALQVYYCVSSNHSLRSYLVAISHQSFVAITWHPTLVFVLVLVLEFPFGGRFHTPYMEKNIFKN